MISIFSPLGVSAEEVGKAAAKQLLTGLSTAASVDEFLQDQVMSSTLSSLGPLMGGSPMSPVDFKK